MTALSPAYAGKPVILIHLTMGPEEGSPAVCADVVPVVSADTEYPKVPRVLCPSCHAWSLRQPTPTSLDATVSKEEVEAYQAQRRRDNFSPLNVGLDQDTWDEYPDETKDELIDQWFKDIHG